MLRRSRLIIRDITLRQSHNGAHSLYRILSRLGVLDIWVSMKRWQRNEADYQGMAQITKVLDALSASMDTVLLPSFLDPPPSTFICHRLRYFWRRDAQGSMGRWHAGPHEAQEIPILSQHFRHISRLQFFRIADENGIRTECVFDDNKGHTFA